MEQKTFFQVVRDLKGLMGRRNKKAAEIDVLKEVINQKVNDLETKLESGSPINKTKARAHIRWLRALAKGDFRNAETLENYDYRLDPYEIQDGMDGNDSNYGFDFENWEEVSLFVQPTVEEDEEPNNEVVNEIEEPTNEEVNETVNKAEEATSQMDEAIIKWDEEVNKLIRRSKCEGTNEIINVLKREAEMWIGRDKRRSISSGRWVYIGQLNKRVAKLRETLPKT